MPTTEEEILQALAQYSNPPGTRRLSVHALLPVAARRLSVYGLLPGSEGRNAVDIAMLITTGDEFQEKIQAQPPIKVAAMINVVELLNTIQPFDLTNPDLRKAAEIIQNPDNSEDINSRVEALLLLPAISNGLEKIALANAEREREARMDRARIAEKKANQPTGKMLKDGDAFVVDNPSLHRKSGEVTTEPEKTKNGSRKAKT